MLDPKEKEKTIKKFKIHDNDTGSPEVQIALLTEKIKKLVRHLKKHAKDLHSKRGLIKMVMQRRKLLKYLKRESEERYNKIIKEVELEK